MDDYISREETLKAFRLTAKNSNKDYQRGLQDAIDCLVPEVIADIPSADVQPINPLVKVEERVPNVSGNYLCYLATDEFEVLYFDRGIEDDMYNNDYPFGVWNTYPSKDGGECREWIEVLEVTHWMPLPKPPKDGAVK